MFTKNGSFAEEISSSSVEEKDGIAIIIFVFLFVYALQVSTESIPPVI